MQPLHTIIKQNNFKSQVGIQITPIHVVSPLRVAIRSLSERVVNPLPHSLLSLVHLAPPPTCATPPPFSAAQIAKEFS